MVKALGTELQLEARVGDMMLRGIIDRLDLNPDGTITESRNAYAHSLNDETFEGVNELGTCKLICPSAFRSDFRTNL